MKERNKLIIAIVAVIAIVVIVVGATYAYWQWTSNAAENTSVTFTVPNKDAQLSASLKGGGSTTVSSLAPAACTNSNYAMMKPMLLTYSNNTSQAARVKATLTITSWNTGGATFTTGQLPHIHYAVTTSSTNCTTSVVSGMSGTFPNNAAANTVLINNVVLKNNITAGGSATDEPYYLWVWLDTDYDGENVGNTISDPMQKLSFQLTWTGTIENITS